MAAVSCCYGVISFLGFVGRRVDATNIGSRAPASSLYILGSARRGAPTVGGGAPGCGACRWGWGRESLGSAADSVIGSLESEL